MYNNIFNIASEHVACTEEKREPDKADQDRFSMHNIETFILNIEGFLPGRVFISLLLIILPLHVLLLET